MAASSSSFQEQRIASDDVLSEEAEEQLNTHIIQTGKALLELSFTNKELLQELDKLENLFSKVRQEMPKKLMKKVLRPATKALVGLLRHGEMDVKISVTSCLTEVMRITAPNEPLDDDNMKEYFQSAVMAFGKLSSMTGHCYSKALSMLQVFADVHLCVVMWDLELDELLVGLFQNFLNSIMFSHPPVVFYSMEKIINVAIESSDKISLDLLHILLASVKKENHYQSPFSFKLGERVLENCASKLEPYLQEAVSCMGISFGDYANIVASICQGAIQRENMDVEELQATTSGLGEVGPSGQSKLLVNNDTGHVRNEENFNANSSNILQQHFDQINQQTSLDVTKQVSESVPYVKKRDRRPNSKLKVEEGYDFSWLPVERSHSKKTRAEIKDAVRLEAAASGHREVGQYLPSKSLVNKNTSDVKNKEKVDANSTKTLHHCDQISKQIDVDVTKQVGEDVPVVKKRDGRPSSLLKPEEEYDFSCLPVEKSYSRKSRTKKKVAERQLTTQSNKRKKDYEKN
ncbi:Tudor/PWWP/MBT superfamily protein [Abeliophyllum distichum]|uniref:Tudor/PWWP/MBT superfamily protein n=1 Tax=Abeliophyllum distichum TaxID=126358 RepID=A0ABD1UMF4_9LAMI